MENEATTGLREAQVLLQRRNSKRIWLQVGSLFTGGLEQPLTDAHFVYDDHQIYHVGTAPPAPGIFPTSRNEPDLILKNAFLLPGLIDAHAHLFLEGGELSFNHRAAHLKKSSQVLLHEAEARLENVMRCGVTAIRDAGDKDGVGLALSRSGKNNPDQPRPYIDSPGPAIHREGRYGSFMGEAILPGESLEDAVRRRVEGGSDRIKLIPTGIINFRVGTVTAKPQLSADELRSLKAAARLWDRPTFAHASGETGVGYAIQAEIDSIEHGFFMSEDQLRRLIDTGLAWVPTFSPVQKQLEFADLFGWDQGVKDHLRRILEGHARLLHRAVEWGAHVVAGSDAGSCAVRHGFGLIEELEYMEQAGMSPLEILHSATGRSAQCIGYAEPLGLLQPGYRSDFLLLQANPTETVSHLRAEKLVHRNGFCLHTPAHAEIPGL